MLRPLDGEELRMRRCGSGLTERSRRDARVSSFPRTRAFLGTEKHPVENSYASYLASHGGFSNAYTSLENTVYYFDVQKDFLAGALDMFSSFFSGPLFSETCTEREMKAVDSENSKNMQNDSWRSYQLLKSAPKRSTHFPSFRREILRPCQSSLATERMLPKAALDSELGLKKSGSSLSSAHLN